MRASSSKLPRLLAALVIACAALSLLPALAAAEPALPPGFQDEVVFSNLDQPTNFRFAADGRVFVAEKSGKILVFDNLNDPTPSTFADLRGDVYDNGDRGLLGLALDPKFSEGRPFVYALYTWDHVLGDPTTPKYGKAGVSGDPDCPTQNSSASCLVSGKLIRLTASGNVGTESKVLAEGWCQQFSSHSIGELQFGPERALYVSGGDGASYESIPDYGQLGWAGYQNACADPPNNTKGTALSPPTSEGGALRSQNLKLLNGAILRLDPDTGVAFTGNPLAASPDPNTRKIVAKGFRNPFRFTFDPASGEIYTGNVGSSEIEEIDRFQAPPTTLFNSGWPCYEGLQHQFQFKELGLNVCNALYTSEPSSTTLPFFNYSHGQSVVPGDECPIDSGSAVGGVSFYEGTKYPGYQGAFFFADSVRGCIWVMKPGKDGKPDPSTTTRFLREGKIYPGVKISEGPGEYLYYADLLGEEGLGPGSIHRIVYAPGAPSARLEANPPYGTTFPLEVSFDASKSTDPSGEALSYEWDLNGDGTFESSGGATRQKSYTKKEFEEAQGKAESGNQVVAVRVKDGTGLTSIAKVTVYPGDKPPVVTITGPAPSFRWAVGTKIPLQGKAIDAKGAEINVPLPYYWTTRLAHCPDPANPTACHSHPLQTFPGIRSPEITAPQHDYPSYIEAILRVSDDRGLSGVAVTNIYPKTVDISVTSNPPGIPLTVGTSRQAAPFTAAAIDNSEILLAGPPTAVLGGKTYAFSGWSDAGVREHPILIGEALTKSFTATYSLVPDPPTPPSGPPPPTTPREKPKTLLGKHPPKQTRQTTARFSFRSDLAGAKFRCKLDGKALVGCRSPRVYKGLKPGSHRVKILAVSTEGVADPTPLKFSWKVLRPRP